MNTDMLIGALLVGWFLFFAYVLTNPLCFT